jgi:hypothetical protein
MVDAPSLQQHARTTDPVHPVGGGWYRDDDGDVAALLLRVNGQTDGCVRGDTEHAPTKMHPTIRPDVLRILLWIPVLDRDLVLDGVARALDRAR